jgi:hypothetical protein
MDTIKCIVGDDRIVVRMNIPGDAPGEYTRLCIHVDRGSGEFDCAFGDVFRNNAYQGYTAFKGGVDEKTDFPVYTH